MPLFNSLIHHIPKECFSPLKHSTSAWASRTRGRSRARSTTDQKPDQDQELVAFHKSFRFIPEAVCFKSSVPLLYSPEQHRQRCPLHPWTFPSRECMGVLSRPRKSKAGWTVTMVIHRSHSKPEAPERPLVTWSRSFDMVGRLHGQACQMAQQRTQWGVRALDCSPSILRSYRIYRTPARWAVAFEKILALLAHCWPSPFGLGHQLHHQTEAFQTCYALR